jgi:hypothetical protein
VGLYSFGSEEEQDFVNKVTEHSSFLIKVGKR